MPKKRKNLLLHSSFAMQLRSSIAIYFCRYVYVNEGQLRVRGACICIKQSNLLELCESRCVHDSETNAKSIRYRRTCNAGEAGMSLLREEVPSPSCYYAPCRRQCMTFGACSFCTFMYTLQHNARGVLHDMMTWYMVRVILYERGRRGQGTLNKAVQGGS
jgi:hypothetical protein